MNKVFLIFENCGGMLLQVVSATEQKMYQTYFADIGHDTVHIVNKALTEKDFSLWAENQINDWFNPENDSDDFIIDFHNVKTLTELDKVELSGIGWENTRAFYMLYLFFYGDELINDKGEF